MRVLILSAILACAYAAPSNFYPVILAPSVIPTLSPGDLQAAAIDAKVKAEDDARALADQARIAADLARDQAQLALDEQKSPAAPIAEPAKVKADDQTPSADQTQLAAEIDAKVQAEDQARLLADQARLAADIAREQAELALENQKTSMVIVDDVVSDKGVFQALPVAAIDAKEKADDQARQSRVWADQTQLAAQIDAKVQAEDQARLLADQARLAADIARERAELALENQKEKIEEVTSIAKEKSGELFWNVEDQKWQAVDAVKTIEAKLGGALASNPAALKSVAYPIVAPVALPYANVVYAPGLIPLAGVKDEKIKDAELEKDSKYKLEQSKLEGLALAPAPISYLGTPWVQAPLALYQPGVLQPVLTPAVKHW